MKRIFIIFALIVSIGISAQELAYQPGEHFKFKIHYGIFKAGYATLDLKTGYFKGKSLYHAVGKGWTVGISKFFMKINDNYESYFDAYNRPYRYIRKINEGGYTMDKELHFDTQKQSVLVINKKKKTAKTYATPKTIHDMISVFYYLRNIDTSKLKKGDEVRVDMFIDEEVYPFKLKFLGKNVLKTKFGKINSLMFRPIVQSGRIFKEDESVTLWISDDKNKMPLLIKAKLMVGSLKASLIEYTGTKYDVNFKK